MISEYRKLAQKEYKTRHDWVGKVILWELCKKLKFHHTNKPESVQENEMHKILRDFEIQSDHQILAWRLDLVIVNKKENLRSCGLCCPGGSLSENQRKRKERQIFVPCQRTKKAMKHESDGDTNCNQCAWNNSRRHGKGAENVGNRRISQDYSNYSIAKNSQNTERVQET